MAAFPPPPGAAAAPAVQYAPGVDPLFSNPEVAAPSWGAAYGVSAPMTVGTTYERFSFRNVHGRLELRSLLREDVERIKATVDVQALTKHVENIAFSDVRMEDVRNMSDEDFVKVCDLTITLRRTPCRLFCGREAD